jgi:hypothetical protein
MEAIVAQHGPFRNPLFSHAFLYEEAAFTKTYPMEMAAKPASAPAAAAAAAGAVPATVGFKMCELPPFGCMTEVLLKANECSEAVAASVAANYMGEESARAAGIACPSVVGAPPCADGTDDPFACVLLTWEWSGELFAFREFLALDRRFHRVLDALVAQLNTKEGTKQTLLDLFKEEIAGTKH